MKKALLIGAFALLASLIQAQPVLTQAAVGAVGSTYYLGIQDTFAPGFTIGTAGASQTWDMSGLWVNRLDTIWFVSPSTSTYASTFPAANIGLKQASLAGGIAFLESNTGYLDLLGLAGDVLGVGQPIVVVQNPPSRVAAFPFTYQNTFNGTSVIDVTVDATSFGIPFVDSARYQNTQVRDLEADGYGTLVLPAGTYNNVLRVKEINDQHTQILVHTFLGWSVYQDTLFTDSTFTWWNDSKGYFLAQAAYVGGALSTIRYEDPVIVGRPEMQENAFRVYPNPAQDRLFVDSDGKLSEIGIYDLQGREVARHKLGGLHAQCSIGDLPNGYYLYSLLDKNGASKQQGKLLVHH